ncbi:MAG: threonine/serine dehydratase [Nitrospirota bacterium]|jgi:threonine dehydratase|nr:threonine/serine dehydratase [Nitrospirota bacterium]MDH4360061.1 threonine/serine dehydratase [Nitrospirota bacterium]MDH5574183.1 threonine/serine dehydratase [Nitrospirota bacterium]
MGDFLPTFSHVQQAATVLNGVVSRTPVLDSSYLDEQCGGGVLVKCENLQRTGAFKFRGAYYALSRKEAVAPFKAVVTLSSGNHAQGIALAGRLLGYPAYIVMPEPVNPFKRERVEEFGASVRIVRTRAEGEVLAQELVHVHQGVFIHPFNDPDVIAGQGTAILELLQAEPEIDVVLAPLGGGGLLSGACLAAHGLNPHIQVYGCEPARALDALLSLREGRILLPHPVDTMAEGLRTSLGEVTLSILQDHLQDVFVVEEEEIIPAMRIAFERMKMVIEPSSAVALAPILRGEPALRGKRVGVVLSGGNISMSDVCSMMGGM